MRTTLANSTSHQAARKRTAPRRPMRLAYLTTEYPKASHTFIRREIVELERRGHGVLRLAIRDSGGAIADEADREEARRTFHCLSRPVRTLAAALLRSMITRPLRAWKGLRVALEMHARSERGLVRHLAYFVEACALLPVLRQHDIEHLHVHFGTNSAAVARIIRALGGPPYSFTVHGPGEFDSPRAFSLGDKVADAEFVAAITDFCAAQIRRWTPHEHWDKIHIVRCTVDDRFFREHAPIPHGASQFVCVGRLTAQKGQHLLIEAMHRLVQSGYDATLVLAGDGEMRPELERRIEALGLQSRVRITGWIDEATVRELLAQSRVLVQPSFAEGLPVVIMEAMAMGRPVIATMIAGIPELVRDREHGWLITAGNLDDLVRAMEEALESPLDRLTEMGCAGRQRVRERHDATGQVDRLEELFRTSINARTCERAPMHARRDPTMEGATVLQ